MIVKANPGVGIPCRAKKIATRPALFTALPGAGFNPWSAPVVAAPFGDAVSFTGTQAFYDYPDITLPPRWTWYSLCRFKGTLAQSYRPASLLGPAGDDFAISLFQQNGTGRRFTGFVYSGSRQDSATTFDVWQEVAIACDMSAGSAGVASSQTFSFYINGIQIGAPVTSSGVKRGQMRLRLGGGTDATPNKWHGYLGRTQLFDVIHTSAEILAHAQSSGVA